MMDGKDLPPLPEASYRSRAKSSVAPSRLGASSDQTHSTAEDSKPSHRRPIMGYLTPGRRPLNSMVRQLLPEPSKFRILVVGQRRSGKSSLIETVFKVDVTTAAPKRTDIDFEFCPEDNRYLIVHASGKTSLASER
ncbi:hypothetical protein EI94DRAFT_1752167 [Lactarius quietus]|nr:hypothetical protein EI94DRAFT_1752167 [Lactarius quietus]